MEEARRHLEEAEKLFQKAVEEFEVAKEKNDSTHLRGACAKGWLSAVEATNALLVKRGVSEDRLPRSERGRRYMVFKHADSELRRLYLAIRDSLHIQGYYNRSLDFDEVKMQLEDLKYYIEKIEEEIKGRA